jgi:hypothetical protein
MSWTTDLVWAREVEAQETICRLPRDEVEGLKAAWPHVLRTFADAVAAEETRAEENYPWPKGWTRPTPPAARAIDRMTEVWAWHQRFLGEDTHAIRIVQGMARAAALHRPLLQGVPYRFRKHRWAMYRTKDRALRTITEGLNAAHVVVQTAEG